MGLEPAKDLATLIIGRVGATLQQGMVSPLLLAVALLSSRSASAQDVVQPTERRPVVTADAEAEKPARQLLQLDQALAKAQEDKKFDRIDGKRYREFLKNFLVDFEAARTRVKPTPPNTVLLARILSRLGDSEQALAALGPALEQDPSNPALRVALSQVYYDQKDYPAALAEANELLKLDPENKGALELKYYSKGRIDPSGATPSAARKGVSVGADSRLEQFRVPAATDSLKVHALVPKIRDARNGGDMRTAMTLAQDLMRAEPASEYTQEIYRIVAKDFAHWQRVHATTGYINRAKVALLAGRGDEALEWANKAVQTDPAPAVMKFTENVRKIVGDGGEGATPQTPKTPTPKDGGIPLWPIFPISGLGAAAYVVAKSRKTVESEDGFDEKNRPLYGRLQQFVAGAILAGLAGAGIYLAGVAVVSAGAPVVMRFMSGPGQQVMQLAQSEVGAINPGEAKVVNEVPKMLARVIPLKDGMRVSGMIGPFGQPTTFVTAAEDIAGTPAALLSERLGIESAPRYAIIRFPMPTVQVASRIAYNENSLFIGRGLTSGGAREFQVPNMPIPQGATIEIVETLK